MRVIFAGTFYWIALINPGDTYHQQIMRYGQTLSSAALLTTEAVVDEVLNFFAGKGSFLRIKAHTLSQRISMDPKIQLIPHRLDFRQMSLDLYRQRSDQGYSLTDCISMVVMDQDECEQSPHS